jgi:hypothetical protein
MTRSQDNVKKSTGKVASVVQKVRKGPLPAAEGPKPSLRNAKLQVSDSDSSSEEDKVVTKPAVKGKATGKSSVPAPASPVSDDGEVEGSKSKAKAKGPGKPTAIQVKVVKGVSKAPAKAKASPVKDTWEMDDDEEPDKYYRPPYTKVKLELAYDTEKPLFRLFDKTPTKRQEVVLSNFEEALDYMRYMTKHRMVIVFHKLYAMKTTAGNEKRKYGIILKAVAVECSNKSAPPGLSNSIDMFLDDDEF